MKTLLWIVPLCLFALTGCGSGGGGLSSANVNAPSTVNAHEANWVTYHRDSLLNTSGGTIKNVNGNLLIDGILINEHVTQCRVCHGPNLGGSRDGYKGTDCLSCHVLDPIKYPVMCYSCHGGWPVTPTAQLIQSQYTSLVRRQGWPVSPLQQWFSAESAKRAGQPIDPAFITAVRTKNIHLKHKAIPSLPYDATLDNNQLSTNPDCYICHGVGASDIANRHHNLFGKTVIFQGQELFISGSCIAPPIPAGGCHALIPDGSGGFTLGRPDCAKCHAPLP